MSKLSRIWGWLLPGLISLSQMGAFAYYVAGIEEEVPQLELRRGRRAVGVMDAA